MSWKRPSYRFKGRSCKSIIKFNDTVLFLKKGKKWDLPGGRVEHGESPDKCIKREVFEETGLVISKIKVLKIVSGNILFCTTMRKRCSIKLSDEHDDYKWININKIKKISPVTSIVNKLLK